MISDDTRKRDFEFRYLFRLMGIWFQYGYYFEDKNRKITIFLKIIDQFGTLKWLNFYFSKILLYDL